MNENSHLLPLQAFFIALQRHPDFSLGIAEYKILLSVLEQYPDQYLAATPVASENLLRLCQLLWLKPNQNGQLFTKLFEQAQKGFEVWVSGRLKFELTSNSEEKKVTPPKEEDKKPEPTPSPPEKETTPPPSEEHKPKTPIETEEADYPTLYLNFQEGGGESIQGKPLLDKSLLLVQNYVPFQWRNLIQIWRRLKDRKEIGAQTHDIDIQASVQKMTRNGFLIEPVYQKQSRQTARLVTLIDHRGSMIAFKHWAQAIADSAVKAGIQNQTYYFRNVPQRYNDDEALLYVYADRGQIKHRPLRDILKENPNAAVLIISDAGTASGSYNMSRIEATEDFLSEVYEHTLKVAWLNPMPQNRWDGSSAYIIRELTDMFEATAEGLQKAIPILKGKKAPRSPIVFPELLNEL